MHLLSKFKILDQEGDENGVNPVFLAGKQGILWKEQTFPDYFLRPFWISLGISYSQGTFVWQRPQPVIFTPYSGLLSDPTV